MDVKVGLLALKLGIDSLSRLLLSYLLHRLGNHAQPARFAVNVARVRIACRLDFHAELDSRGFWLVLAVGRQHDTIPLRAAFPSSFCASIRHNPSAGGMVGPPCLSDGTKSPIAIGFNRG